MSNSAEPDDDGERLEQRLDKWLWHARLTKSRGLAVKTIEAGCVRINRVRASKPSQCVKCGDVLTLQLNGNVRVIEVLGFAERRGPVAEALLLYKERVIATGDGS